MAGTYGNKAERKCSVPSNKSIFFPIINDLISFAEYYQLKTEADLAEYAKSDLDTTSILSVTVDNVKIPNLEQFRVRTPLFNIDYPLEDYDNTRGIKSSKPTSAISDGYWIFLRPLTYGKHFIHFKGEKMAFDEIYNKNDTLEQPKFSVEVIYEITVNR